MSTAGSTEGTGKKVETLTMEGLAAQLAALKLAQAPVSTKVKKIEDNDEGVKDSQRKLAKLPTPPMFKGNPADLEG
jgi:hypothetical protein